MTGWHLTLSMIRDSAASCEPSVCLVGNVRAGDIVRACDAALLCVPVYDESARVLELEELLREARRLVGVVACRCLERDDFFERIDAALARKDGGT